MAQLKKCSLLGQGTAKVCHESPLQPRECVKAARSRAEVLADWASCLDPRLEKAPSDLSGSNETLHIEVTDARAGSKTRTALPQCSFCHRTIKPDRDERLDGEYECYCGTMFYLEHDGRWREAMDGGS
jgi:hypothetical protein